MTITLFHGSLGLVAAILLVVGAGAILTAIQNWLRDRFTLDLHPLWHVIPRRFKVHLRWDRRGAYVTFQDGREGVLLEVFGSDDSPYPMAVVQSQEDEAQGPAEWVPLSAPTAVPARSFREFVRYLRNGDA
jgi:hypothetical protein